MSSGYNGYLMLNKEIKRHEFYTDPKTFRLYFHLLVDANFIEGSCNGIVVKRGQKLTSLNSLIIETGLTEREVRTALEKLINRNHIIKKATNKNTLLTVVEYERYTGLNESKDKPTTNQRQTKDKPTTIIEEYNNLSNKELKKIERVDKNLSHFDFLKLNYEAEVLELVTKYKPKIKGFDFCIEKFNDQDYKNVTITKFKKWLQDEFDYKKSKNLNSDNHNYKFDEISYNHPSRRKII